MTSQNEALFAAAKPFHAQRDQHHAVARSRLRVAYHFHDYDAIAREQHEPGDPVQRRTQSANQLRAASDSLDRSERRDQAEQSSSRSCRPERATERSETRQSR